MIFNRAYHYMFKAEHCINIFNQAIEDYHRFDDVDAILVLPEFNSIQDQELYKKCWIDTVQWHLEDIIRIPSLPAEKFIETKRRIDISNQWRTDMVEHIDQWFADQYISVNVLPNARMNTETPAWAIDRLSILCLKIYHMQEQVQRTDSTEELVKQCRTKLEILLMQQEDLVKSLNELIEEISQGKTLMRTYQQMKMYNDPKLNPQLYAKPKI